MAELFTDNLGRLLLWGLVATTAMTTILQGSQGLGLSRLNLPFLAGTLFTPNRSRAVVIGLEREQSLRGITMSSPDIRAGVALLIAALSASESARVASAISLPVSFASSRTMNSSAPRAEARPQASIPSRRSSRAERV